MTTQTNLHLTIRACHQDDLSTGRIMTVLGGHVLQTRAIRAEDGDLREDQAGSKRGESSITEQVQTYRDNIVARLETLP